MGDFPRVLDGLPSEGVCTEGVLRQFLVRDFGRQFVGGLLGVVRRFPRGGGGVPRVVCGDAGGAGLFGGDVAV